VRGKETAASRAKAAALTTLTRDLVKEKIGHLDRQKPIAFGKMPAKQGAGPVSPGSISARTRSTSSMRF
jgi:hypothetical protein